MEALKFTPLASFSGLRGVPLLALSHNSLFPALALDAEGVTIKVLRSHRFLYGEIAVIELDRRLGRKLTFVPKRGWRDFTVSFAGPDMARAVIEALQRFDAPLSPHALAIPSGSAPARR
ncbi:hypothetical protein [Bosea sp. (in: a-proteobacteria)]|uniref:hypothetical protein n=1 Tax=Bosea sp. (in: a-proteobacteria) TaxID=1871050 RepID=UPI002FC8C9E7